MSATWVETVRSLATSPGTHLAVGGAMFFGVKRLAKEIEDMLTDDARFSIALWLLGVEDAQETFVRTSRTRFSSFALISGRLLGPVNSLGFALKVAIVWVALTASTIAGWIFKSPDQFASYADAVAPPFLEFGPAALIVGLIPTYLAMRSTAYLFQQQIRFSHTGRFAAAVLVDLFAAVMLVYVSYYLYCRLFEPYESNLAILRQVRFNLDASPGTAPLSALFYPSFFPALVALGYGLSGGIIILMRRTHQGFSWLNRNMDIEKKPLQCIATVFACLLVFGYWSAVILLGFRSSI